MRNLLLAAGQTSLLLLRRPYQHMARTKAQTCRPHLLANLPGYDAYAKRVRGRLIPFLL